MLARPLCRGLDGLALATGRPAARALGRRPAGSIQCNRGFGKVQPKKEKEEDTGSSDRVKTVKFKGKRSMRQGPTSMPAEQYKTSKAQLQTSFVMAGEEDAEPAESLTEQLEFEARLRALRAETVEKVAAAEPQERNLLDSPKAADLYANPPPPLAQTLMGGKADEAGSGYEGAQFGPSQVALGAVSLVLVAVFVLTSGAGDVPSSSGRGQRGGAGAELSSEDRKALEAQLAASKDALAADAGDLEALEAAAVTNARLGNYEEAAAQLAALTAASPGDADAWRVLGEARTALGDGPAAVAAYRRAWEASGKGDLEILTGLAAALVADGKDGAAADVVVAARDAAAAAGPSAGGIGEAEARLLLGKVYSQRRGGASDALAVYDGLIDDRPDDFRAYLAKGLLLQAQGSPGDAQRYFLQAKFHAPPESRPVVDALIKSR